MTKLTFSEALAQLRTLSKEKFDATVEVHINLNVDRKKVESLRYSVVLPNGTGRTQKVAVLASEKIDNADLELNEQDIEKLEKGTIKPKVDFDVLIAEPRFMPKLAKAAKVLGPAGVMPNPKNGTVSEDVKKAVDQVKKGRVEVRMEQNVNIIHTIIGKRSFDDIKLNENYTELISSLKQNKPQKAPLDWVSSIFISTSMSPSVEVLVENL